MKKILLLFLILFVCSCSNKQTKIADNEYFKEQYNIEKMECPLYKIEYDRLIEIENNNSNTLVFLSRSDCDYCRKTLVNFINMTQKKEDLDVEELFILETDKLTDKEKEDLSTKYMTSSVPTFIKFNNDLPTIVEIGELSSEELYELQKKINEE